MRFWRAAVIALLVLLMAVTPLSALISPGQFEIRSRPQNSWSPSHTVRLDDHTGLARGLAFASPPRGAHDEVTGFGSAGRMLIVAWEGSSCDDLTQLTFEGAESGYRIRQSTHQRSCVHGSGAVHAVAISLWAPIDASTVLFDSVGREYVN